MASPGSLSGVAWSGELSDLPDNGKLSGTAATNAIGVRAGEDTRYRGGAHQSTERAGWVGASLAPGRLTTGLPT
jgi:hypothetical protein